MDVLLPRLGELVPSAIVLLGLFVFVAFGGTVGLLVWRSTRGTSQRSKV